MKLEMKCRKCQTVLDGETIITYPKIVEKPEDYKSWECPTCKVHYAFEGLEANLFFAYAN